MNDKTNAFAAAVAQHTTTSRVVQVAKTTGLVAGFIVVNSLITHAMNSLGENIIELF
jgi:hypothetical protein